MVSFRREKFQPKGGPDGGDGGKGGDVVIIADPRRRTLLELQQNPHRRGKDGGHGQSGKKRGRDGADCTIRVPIGTLVYDADTSELLADLKHAGDSCLVLKGGRGGRGNASFANPSRQAPRFAELGEPGQERRLRLELKLLADVGVIGFPNAGKSTLVSRLSAARPKIADYPFTTLTPTLGAVFTDSFTSFIIADIPGIIEGAHAGRGLGHQFLKHVERTKVLIHLLDFAPPAERDPVEDFEQLNKELALFNPELSLKPQVVAANKLDIPEGRERFHNLASIFAARGVELLPISAATGEGLDRLLSEVLRHLRVEQAESVSPPQRFIAPPPRERPTKISVSFDEGYVVTGSAVEKLIAMTDINNPEALHHLHKRLREMGIIKMLKEAGIRDGDFVRIGNFVCNYVDEESEGEPS